jgi:hypothetical protein
MRGKVGYGIRAIIRARRQVEGKAFDVHPPPKPPLDFIPTFFFPFRHLRQS